jgi:hypothetical protein
MVIVKIIIKGYGTLEDVQVCENLGDHMVCNV